MSPNIVGRVSEGQGEYLVEEVGYRVVAVEFFSEREIASFPTRDQAKWRAKELNEWAERNPRGYIPEV